MSFTKESIKKVVTLMNEKKRVYADIPADKIKMCISNGNRKIGRVMNVSLPPIITCANCKECKYLCYDIKACLQYPETVIDARIRNYSILIKNRDEFFSRIDKKMKARRKNKFFRWHVAGDIVDIDYFNRMINLAKKHPDFTVWTYTKNYAVVNEWVKAHGGNKKAIPANFSIMFSEWRGMEMINPFGFQEFRVVFKSDTEKPDPTKNYFCPGNCDICKASKRGCIAHETVYCNEH